jgi:hypothetical protein
MTYALASLEDLDHIAVAHGLEWRPVRRQLGVHAFGVNACLEARAGRPDESRAHLARALELRPDLVGQAREDTDLKEVV